MKPELIQAVAAAAYHYSVDLGATRWPNISETARGEWERVVRNVWVLFEFKGDLADVCRAAADGDDAAARMVWESSFDARRKWDDLEPSFRAGWRSTVAFTVLELLTQVGYDRLQDLARTLVDRLGDVTARNEDLARQLEQLRKA